MNANDGLLIAALLLLAIAAGCDREHASSNQAPGSPRARASAFSPGEQNAVRGEELTPSAPSPSPRQPKPSDDSSAETPDPRVPLGQATRDLDHFARDVRNLREALLTVEVQFDANQPTGREKEVSDERR